MTIISLFQFGKWYIKIRCLFLYFSFIYIFQFDCSIYSSTSRLNRVFILLNPLLIIAFRWLWYMCLTGLHVHFITCRMESCKPMMRRLAVFLRTPQCKCCSVLGLLENDIAGWNSRFGLMNVFFHYSLFFFGASLDTFYSFYYNNKFYSKEKTKQNMEKQPNTKQQENFHRKEKQKLNIKRNVKPKHSFPCKTVNHVNAISLTPNMMKCSFWLLTAYALLCKLQHKLNCGSDVSKNLWWLINYTCGMSVSHQTMTNILHVTQHNVLACKRVKSVLMISIKYFVHY